MEIMTQRIQEDVHLQCSIYEDEIVNAFKKVEYVREISKFNHTLKSLFANQDEVDEQLAPADKSGEMIDVFFN